MKPPTIKRPCPVCVKKFEADNGRRPNRSETPTLNTVVCAEIACQACYREWAFHIAGIAEPPDYQTFDQALASVQQLTNGA